jgi:hypothetical protein
MLCYSCNVLKVITQKETEYDPSFAACQDCDESSDTETNTEEVATPITLDAPSELSIISPTSSPSFDSDVVVRVNGVQSGYTVTLYNDSSCSNEITSVAATDSFVDITASGLTAGPYTFYASALDENLNSSDCSEANVSYTVYECPSGYIPVPKNSSLGVETFCVMQFEARNNGFGIPESQSTGTPWVNMNQANVKTLCNSIGANYDLISNPEWMTIAYEIEKTAQNWSNSIVGSGMLNRGHSDGNPLSALTIANINDPYDGTGNNSSQAVNAGWEQKRTHTLSNGETIWDFSGNVFEWIDWTLGGALATGPASCTIDYLYTELFDVSCGLSNADFSPDNPAGIAVGNYNQNYGLGTFSAGTTGSPGGGPYRGGFWNSNANAGVFNLFMRYQPTYIASVVGFRCVYRP